MRPAAKALRCWPRSDKASTVIIATATGHSHYVTGEAGLDHLHRLRALSDVVVVGAGTAVADDPRLTVRRADGPNPVRALIDVGGRVSRDRRMFHDGAAPTLVLTSPETLARHPVPDGVETVAVAGTDGALPPAAIVEALSARGLKRILIEGGGVTISRFLEAGRTGQAPCLRRPAHHRLGPPRTHPASGRPP